MTQRHWIAAVATTVFIAACSSSDYLSIGAAGAPSQSASPWTGEAQAVRELTALPNVVLAAILIAMLLLVSRVARSAVGFGWRLGLDPRRRLAAWLGAAQLAVAGIVLYVVTVRFLDAAPAFALATLALAVGATVVVLGRPLQSVWAGLLLRLRMRLREGDRISVAGHAGVVREIGLLRTEVRAEDGSSVFLPNRIVAQDVVSVEPGRGTTSVRTRVPIEPGSFSDAGERLRRVAALSPYRAPRTPIVVTRADDATSVWVEIQVWSFGAVRAAERHLAAALLAPPRSGESVPRQRAGGTEPRVEG